MTRFFLIIPLSCWLWLSCVPSSPKQTVKNMPHPHELRLAMPKATLESTFTPDSILLEISQVGLLDTTLLFLPDSSWHSSSASLAFKAFPETPTTLSLQIFKHGYAVLEAKGEVTFHPNSAAPELQGKRLPGWDLAFPSSIDTNPATTPGKVVFINDSLEIAALSSEATVTVRHTGETPVEFSFSGNADWLTASTGSRLDSNTRQTDLQLSIDKSSLEAGWHHTMLYLMVANRAVDSLAIKTERSAIAVPTLKFDSDIIDFGSSGSEIQVELINPTGGTVSWELKLASDAWVTASPEKGNLTTSANRAAIHFVLHRERLPGIGLSGLEIVAKGDNNATDTLQVFATKQQGISVGVNRLEGFVREKTTSRPLAGVQIVSGSETTTTDERGFYFFEEMAPGKQTVVATLSGRIGAADTITLGEEDTLGVNLILSKPVDFVSLDADWTPELISDITFVGNAALAVAPEFRGEGQILAFDIANPSKLLHRYIPQGNFGADGLPVPVNKIYATESRIFLSSPESKTIFSIAGWSDATSARTTSLALGFAPYHLTAIEEKILISGVSGGKLALGTLNPLTFTMDDWQVFDAITADLVDEINRGPVVQHDAGAIFGVNGAGPTSIGQLFKIDPRTYSLLASNSDLGFSQAASLVISQGRLTVGFRDSGAEGLLTLSQNLDHKLPLAQDAVTNVDDMTHAAGVLWVLANRRLKAISHGAVVGNFDVGGDVVKLEAEDETLVLFGKKIFLMRL